MFARLVHELENRGYWYNVIGNDNTFLLNVVEPEKNPKAEDWDFSKGVLLRVQVLKYELLVRWTSDNDGYDETWEFPCVPEFMEFLNKFLIDGVDGV